MDVYLINEKENDKFHFPVNPLDELARSRDKRYETVDIIDVGEIDIIKKGKNIVGIRFETILPEQYYEFCRYTNIPNPKESVEKLNKWMDLESPLRLIITDFDFNDIVILSNLDEFEKTGEVGDKYISIAFRTYRELKVEEIKKQTNKPISPPLNNRPNTKSNSKTYSVVKGDTLYKISKKFYGNGSKWKKIYDVPENKKTIGSNPNLIKPGQKLVIP